MGNGKRPVLLALAGVIVVAAFFVVRPASTPGPALRDFEAYYAAGAAWHYEGDPYGRDVWRAEKDIPGVIATRDEVLPFVGPPFGLPLWSALSRLPWNVAVDVWQGALACSFAAIALGSLRLSGRTRDAPDALAVLVVAAGFGPLTSGLALGQVAIVSTAAIVIAALVLAGRDDDRAFGLAGMAVGGDSPRAGGRTTGSGLVAALVAGLQPTLAVVLIALLGRSRAWIALAGAAVFALAGSALALETSGLGLGPRSAFTRYPATLRAHGAAERFIAIQTTPGAIARALGASAQNAGFIAAGCALVVVAGIAVLWAGGRYTAISRLALACAALPLALPFAHEHDYVIVFLPAIVTIRRARGSLWVIAAIGTLLAGTDWLGLAQRPEGAAQTMLLTLAAGLGLVTLTRGPLRIEYVVPPLLAFVVLAASFLAAGHRLPIWPDALPANFHVPATMKIAEVWHLEEVRSGIARLDPTWGFLRLASLAGCVLLLIAACLALPRRAGKAV
ncbi:MAG: DUF2029 domain-containing protein [Candidatus Eremiobacteraeota bacterium]|nr:DUF2029 domain-containing protein [Candidatus Eremiobacteraeota bacterium]